MIRFCIARRSIPERIRLDDDRFISVSRTRALLRFIVSRSRAKFVKISTPEFRIKSLEKNWKKNKKKSFGKIFETYQFLQIRLQHALHLSADCFLVRFFQMSKELVHHHLKRKMVPYHTSPILHTVYLHWLSSPLIVAPKSWSRDCLC